MSLGPDASSEKIRELSSQFQKEIEETINRALGTEVGSTHIEATLGRKKIGFSSKSDAPISLRVKGELKLLLVLQYQCSLSDDGQYLAVEKALSRSRLDRMRARPSPLC